MRHGTGPRRPLRAIALLLAAGLLGSSCSGPAADAGRDEPPAGLETTYDVTYTSDTTVIDSDEAAALLISASEDGRSFRLRPNDELRSLRPGQVVILGGVGLGRVAEIRDEGGELVLETTEASLGDAIADGEIGWS
ncbi:MAG: hypothetical protein ACRDHD_10350, partial [Candidatus Limnocylindria bacterium]